MNAQMSAKEYWDKAGELAARRPRYCQQCSVEDGFVPLGRKRGERVLLAERGGRPALLCERCCRKFGLKPPRARVQRHRVKAPAPDQNQLSLFAETRQ